MTHPSKHRVKKLLFIQQIGFATDFELLYILFPARFDLIGVGPIENHAAHVIYPDELFEHRREELFAESCLVVTVDDVAQIHAAIPDLLIGGFGAQVHPVAYLVFQRRIFCSRIAVRGEPESVRVHLRVSVHLEREIGAASEARRSAFEKA